LSVDKVFIYCFNTLILHTESMRLSSSFAVVQQARTEVEMVAKMESLA